MKEKKVFEEPEITTYDRQELDLETAVTGEVDSRLASARRLKENFQTVDPREVLDKLLGL